MSKRPKPEPTDPGDSIEVSVSAEVRTRRGGSVWVKAGLTSTHRASETSDEAYARVADFVIERVEELTDEFLE